MNKKCIPNCITSLRIIGAILLIPFKIFSPVFFTIYTLSGVTDILDGFIARVTKSTSAFGSKLDSAADLTFYGIMIIKIFPYLLKHIPAFLWWMAGLVLAIRIVSYITAAVKFHKFSSLHTPLNKLTGVFVFIIPYFAVQDNVSLICFIAVLIAGAASIEELVIHLFGDKLHWLQKSEQNNQKEI